MRVLALAFLAITLAAPAAAQDRMPTELWSEYPLVQEVKRTSQPNLGPLLPPTQEEPDVIADDAPQWVLWALVAATGAIVLLVATGLKPRRPRSRVDSRVPVGLRRDGRLRTSPSSLPLAQYAPSSSLVLVDAPEGPLRSVVRRTGLLRSRYVVLERRSGGEQDAVGESRSFWNVGGSSMRERLAEDAWDELVNDLRVSGWEPDPTRRSDFYVLLQPVEPEESSIVPTIEAYGRSDESET